MDAALIRLVTRAAREGLHLDPMDGHAHTAGTAAPDTLNRLRARRDDITALLAGGCAACGATPWIREHDTSIPWCRPHARQRGEQLLRHERPDLLADDRRPAP